MKVEVVEYNSEWPNLKTFRNIMLVEVSGYLVAGYTSYIYLL